MKLATDSWKIQRDVSEKESNGTLNSMPTLQQWFLVSLKRWECHFWSKARIYCQFVERNQRQAKYATLISQHPLSWTRPLVKCSANQAPSCHTSPSWLDELSQQCYAQPAPLLPVISEKSDAAVQLFLSWWKYHLAGILVPCPNSLCIQVLKKNRTCW